MVVLPGVICGLPEHRAPPAVVVPRAAVSAAALGLAMKLSGGVNCWTRLVEPDQDYHPAFGEVDMYHMTAFHMLCANPACSSVVLVSSISSSNNNSLSTLNTHPLLCACERLRARVFLHPKMLLVCARLSECALSACSKMLI